MVKDSKVNVPLTQAPTDSGGGPAITDLNTGKLDSECKDYDDIGTRIWDEWTDLQVELEKMERILSEMDNFQKENRNVHKPLKDWISNLMVLTEKVRPMKKQVRSTCLKISEEVGRLHHIAAGHAEMSLRAMENSILLNPEASSSPAASKKKKMRKGKDDDAAVENLGTWAEVTKKKAKARKNDPAQVNVKHPPPPPRLPRSQPPKILRKKPDAVLIKAPRKEGEDPVSSYASIAARLKEKVDLTAIGVSIDKVRMTKAGDLLLEVGGNEPAPAELGAAITTALGDLGEATMLQQKVAVEFRGVDITATEEDIRYALKARSGEEPHRIGRLRRVLGGTMVVEVLLSRRTAEMLLFDGRFKIGWGICKVRLKVRSSRCFRCQGYGHYAASCKGPDRKNVCMRCGEEGHIAVRCSKKPSCPLCKEKGFETDHVSGDVTCRVKRENNKDS